MIQGITEKFWHTEARREEAKQRTLRARKEHKWKSHPAYKGEAPYGHITFHLYVT